MSKSEEVEKCMSLEIAYKLFKIMEQDEFEDGNVLEKLILKYLSEHFDDAAQHEEFVEISQRNLMEILESPELHYESEETKWNAMIMWVKKSVP